VAITKLDCLDELEEIPICLGYRLDGKPVSDLPALAEDVARLEPVYERFPGWKATTTGATRYEQLPATAQRYVRALEDAIGAPAVFVSTGPRREETIWRTDMPFLAALPSAP
jgi:adenylosuccinate synthase